MVCKYAYTVLYYYFIWVVNNLLIQTFIFNTTINKMSVLWLHKNNIFNIKRHKDTKRNLLNKNLIIKSLNYLRII